MTLQAQFHHPEIKFWNPMDSQVMREGSGCEPHDKGYIFDWQLQSVIAKGTLQELRELMEEAEKHGEQAPFTIIPGHPQLIAEQEEVKAKKESKKPLSVPLSNFIPASVSARFGTL